jgi:methyl-accepting chemotaxis protein
MKRTYRRRILVVGTLQLRLLAITISHFVVFAALVSVALFAPLVVQLESGIQAPQQQHQAAVDFLYLHTHFWPALVVVCVFLGFHSLLVSHRIAGPLFNFRRVLGTIGDGDLTVRVTIRRHDYLREEADAINGMIAGLAGRVGELRRAQGGAAAAWAEVRRGLEDGGPLAARQVETLGARMLAVEAAMEAFRIPDLPASASGATVAPPPAASPAAG